MEFSDIIPFEEAMQALAKRDVLPTSMDSAALQQMGADFHRQNFTSAQTLIADLLEKYKADVDSIINPETGRRAANVTAENPQGYVTTGLNQTRARTEIQQLLKSLGYAPDPKDAGTIKDLSSDQRVELVLRTNVQMSQGQGLWLQSQREGVLDAFPADELFRLEARVKERDWLARWRLAGEQTDDPIGTGWTITTDGRMIALKNHPIWDELGSSDNFPDGLDQPWPPFAFNSGMWVRDVSRADCEEIGLVEDQADIPQPKTLAEVAA